MLRDPADKLEGDSILHETPGDLGLLLWGTARDVALWGTTPQKRRGALFSDGTGDGRFALLAGTEIPSTVSASVDTLHGMLAVPGRADAEIVSLCCLEVAAWARAAGLPHTAVAFAQAGAMAAPRFGDAALCVGVHARAAGQDARSETWLRRAVAVARREGNRVAYASALVELGAVYEARGETARAERFYRFAFRAACRHSARTARMRAAHGLFRLALRQGDYTTAAQFAWSALHAFEPDAEQAAAADLLMDLARFWTDAGQQSPARWALRRLVPALLTMPPAGQLAALALTARAQAQWGRVQSGRSAARAAWVLLADDSIPDPVRYSAAVDLAHAARVAGHLAGFQRAKRVVLRLAPRAEFAAVAARMAKLWPDGEPPAMERAT
jgi:tetratricopeptide (TPR) repeat protein